jgi:HlyD family secretion protein
MTASADVITETKYNALAIPIQSVTVRTLAQLKPTEPDKGGDEAIADVNSTDDYRPDKEGFVELVWVVQDGKVQAKQVKTGIQSETHIEIIEGLHEDDEVVTGSYRAISKDLANGTVITVDNDKNPEKTNS